MKHYIDDKNEIYAYEDDGSQDHLIGNKKPITKAKRDALIKAREEEAFANLSYQRKRAGSYPSVQEFADAMYKAQHLGDDTQLKAYFELVASVKAKYPKTP